MRPLLRSVIPLLAAVVLGGCSLAGHNSVPEGDAWRSQVVTAIAETPGVTATRITVHDVDSGTGHSGPLIQGALSVEGDTAQVLGRALRRASDVLGEDSAGVRINLSVVTGGTPRPIEDFGYRGVSNGRALWRATH